MKPSDSVAPIASWLRAAARFTLLVLVAVFAEPVFGLLPSEHVAQAWLVPVSVITQFDVPMITDRDGLQRQPVERKRRPMMLRGGVCA